MTFSFHTLAVAAAILCFALAVVWSIAPKWMLAVWGISYSYPVGLVSRRGAAVFLGVAMIFYLARDAALSPARTAISIGFIVGALALASLGIWEFVTRNARATILSAVVVELAIAAAFMANVLAVH
jgi:hypothetical protein